MMSNIKKLTNVGTVQILPNILEGKIDALHTMAFMRNLKKSGFLVIKHKV
jgi:hypothetical protein